MRIDEPFRPKDIDRLVNVEEATASRRIFSDQAIFELEIERIFGRAWLYIGHQSEIPAEGDFVTRLMGEDPVILVRGAKDKINVLLNSCPHRGTMVCRADVGATPGFVCPYHGWAFNHDGRLLATSGDDGIYQGKVDFRSLDMRSAKVASYAGLIYATWNEDAPSLDDYLGDARWYIDLFFNRTPQGAEVLGAPHRWELQTNWKIGPMNFAGDGPHFTKVHGPIAAVTLGLDRPILTAAIMAATGISWGNGHNGVAQFDPDPAGKGYFGVDPQMIPLMEKTLKADQLQIRKQMMQGVNTIFPNNSWTQNPVNFTPQEPPVSFLALRVWQPVAANRTQVWNWFFADKESSQEWKEKAAITGIRSFSVGGTFDMDDAEAWGALGRGVKARQVKGQIVSFQAALAHQDVPVKEWPGPGRTYASGFAETTEFDILVEWKKYLSGQK